jgi:hypothetical protein
MELERPSDFGADAVAQYARRTPESLTGVQLGRPDLGSDHRGTLVDLHRLRAPSPSQAKTRYAGRCSACEKPIRHGDRVVYLYGEPVHHDCAYYRPIGKHDRRSARSQHP